MGCWNRSPVISRSLKYSKSDRGGSCWAQIDGIGPPVPCRWLPAIVAATLIPVVVVVVVVVVGEEATGRIFLVPA